MKPITIRFETVLTLPDFGKILITIENDAATPIGDPIWVFIGIKSPLGVLKEMPVLFTSSTADLEIDDGDSETFKIAYPLNSDGSAIEGEYEFTIKISDSANLEDTIQEIKTFDFCPVSSTVVPDFDSVVDCVLKKLVVTDRTNYGTLTPIREITIDHPVIPGVTPIVDTVSSDAEVVIAITHTGVTYNATLEVDFTTTTTEDTWSFIISEGINVIKAILISCDQDLCGLAACMNTKYLELVANACARGGFGRLDSSDIDTWMAMVAYFQLYRELIICKKYNEAQVWKDKLTALLGDCICSETTVKLIPDDDRVVFLTGPTGPAGVAGPAGPEGPAGDGAAKTDWVDVVFLNEAVLGPPVGGNPDLRWRKISRLIILQGYVRVNSNDATPDLLNCVTNFGSLADDIEGVQEFLVWDSGNHIVVGTGRANSSKIELFWDNTFVASPPSGALVHINIMIPLDD